MFARLQLAIRSKYDRTVPIFDPTPYSGAPSRAICTPHVFVADGAHMNWEWVLKSWMGHFQRVHAVEHFFLYSDDSRLLPEVAKKLSHDTNVTLVDLGGQSDYYQHSRHQKLAIWDCALRAAALGVEWTFFGDLDELLNWPAQLSGVRWHEAFSGLDAVTFGSVSTSAARCLSPGLVTI